MFPSFANWEPNDEYNLCTPGMDGSKSKVQAFKNVLSNDEKILICTHATPRFAFEELEESKFNNLLLAIDEFHYVSARLRSETELRRAKVELQGIEPWSREDKRVRSTCLVDFDCREKKGRQRPHQIRSCCCLDSHAQHATAQFC